ncbi:Surface antigen [Enhygromyxa salina]|uniref:Surface antigen n=1 Tax=Enhygromyxa salina TaxID=215803 RepID=A0A2S9XFW4_9BACT|nr:BamA/TamA family outer membrane protein [Enhygromyxa salina]PRP91752.1 Surface antigen [Enhygromyxa salina]
MLIGSVALGLWLSWAPPAEAVEAPASEAKHEQREEKKREKKKRKKKKREKKKRDPDDPHRLEVGVLPAISYDIDLGFGFGALMTLARFHPDYQPYRWRLEIVLNATAKNTPGVGVRLPFHDDYIKADFPGLWGGRLRINTQLRFRRFTNQGWFGIGNATPSLEPWETIDPEVDPDAFAAARRYHQYDRIYPMLDFNTRLILWDRSRTGNDARRACGPKRSQRCPPSTYSGVGASVDHKQRLEALIGTSIAYDVINPYPDTKLSEDLELRETDSEDGETLRGLVHGTQNHALWTLNLGLLYDTRDHEYMPTRGSFTELSGRFSPGVDQGLVFGHLFLGTAVFVPLYGEYLVLATRGALDYLVGKPPFYELGQFGVLVQRDGPGGSWSVRGVPRQRYFGKQKALVNLELRSMFVRFDIARQRFGLGALAFVDAGRVWTDYRPVELAGANVDGPFGDIKVGLGGGLRITWGETLVIRADPAWSPTDQNFGFYLDIGQMF